MGTSCHQLLLICFIILKVLLSIPSSISHNISQLSSKRGDDVLFREVESEGNMKVSSSTKVDRVSFARIFNSANDGKAESCYFLGLIYLYELGEDLTKPMQSAVQAPEELAVQWLTIAARKGHIEAKEAIGLILYHGYKSVETDVDKAIIWFYEMVKAGISRGKWLLGRALFEKTLLQDQKSNNTEAIEMLSDALSSGIPDAMHYLGVLSEYNLITTENFNAEHLYKQAFEKDFVESGYHLGLLYTYGRTVHQDFTQATDTFRQCALKFRHAPSMRYLAMFSIHGHGMPVNYEHAVYWFQMCMDTEDKTVVDQCKNEKAELDHLLIEAESNFYKVLDAYTFGS